MDLALVDTQQMLADACRDFIANRVGFERLKELEKSGPEFDAKLWSAIVANGWTGAPFMDAERTDLGHLGVLLREFGRAAVASPFFQSVAAAGVMVHRLGDTPLAHKLIDRISNGAFSALVSPMDPTHVTSGQREGEAIRFSGGPFLVEWGHCAEFLVCPVRLDQSSFVLLAVDPKASGVEINVQKAFDNEWLAQVYFRDAVVDNSGQIVSAPLPLEQLEQALATVRLLRAIEMAGGAERVLELTVDYVKGRNQFGRPLGSFQAVQHMCADMRIESDGASLSTWEALSFAELGAPFLDRAAMATFFAGRAYERVVIAAAQLHGGMGFTAEYHLQFYYRRAKAQRVRLGTVPFQLENVARNVVDRVVQTGRLPTCPLTIS